MHYPSPFSILQYWIGLLWKLPSSLVKLQHFRFIYIATFVSIKYEANCLSSKTSCHTTVWKNKRQPWIQYILKSNGNCFGLSDMMMLWRYAKTRTDIAFWLWIEYCQLAIYKYYGLATCVNGFGLRALMWGWTTWRTSMIDRDPDFIKKSRERSTLSKDKREASYWNPNNATMHQARETTGHDYYWLQRGL